MRPADLVAAAECEQVIQNAARARQLERVHDLAVACAEDPTDMDPDSETGLEIAGVLGVSHLTMFGWLDLHPS